MSSQPERLSGVRRWLIRRLVPVESLARAMWDAREIRDPSDVAENMLGDTSPAPMWWDETLATGAFPGDRRDAIEDARMTLELLR